MTRVFLTKFALVAAVTVLGVGIGLVAPYIPQFWSAFRSLRVGSPLKVDLMFVRGGGVPVDMDAYQQRRSHLRGTSDYIREIGEDIYQDFDRQRFIIDSMLDSSQFENSNVSWNLSSNLKTISRHPVDIALAEHFGILLRNNTNKPVIFELGGLKSDDVAIQNWHSVLWWYGGLDKNEPLGYTREKIAEGEDIFLEKQGGRFTFPGKPVPPGDFMVLEFAVANTQITGVNDRYILAKLNNLIQAGRKVDLNTLTTQLHNTIVVYQLPGFEEEGFYRVQVDMFLDTRPDDEPNFVSSLVPFSNISDIGEVGVKLHLEDKLFWDELLKNLRSSYEEFTDPARPRELVPDKRAATDPVSDFHPIITDDGKPFGFFPQFRWSSLPSYAPLASPPFTKEDYQTFLEIEAKVFYPYDIKEGIEKLRKLSELKDGDIYIFHTPKYSGLPSWLGQYLQMMEPIYEQERAQKWRQVFEELSKIPKFKQSANRIHIQYGSYQMNLPRSFFPTNSNNTGADEGSNSGGNSGNVQNGSPGGDYPATWITHGTSLF